MLVPSLAHVFLPCSLLYSYLATDSEDYSGRLRKLRLIKALQDQATQMKGDECIYEVVNWLQNDDMITRFIHKRNKFGHYTKRMLYDEDNEDDDQDGVAGLAASLEDADIVDEGKNGRSADGSGNGKDKNKDNGEGEGADLDFSAMFEEGELAMLGKEKTRIKIGLVGLPNIGKSSLFNLMSGLQVPAEAYPFCTIDCNKAVVAVPDERLSHLVDLINPTRHVPPVVEILDIAGLVKGASEGYGLGNAFLHHISTVHVIFHLVRAFPDPSVEHVEGDLDPVRDLKIITHELILKDMERMVRV